MCCFRGGGGSYVFCGSEKAEAKLGTPFVCKADWGMSDLLCIYVFQYLESPSPFLPQTTWLSVAHLACGVCPVLCVPFAKTQLGKWMIREKLSGNWSVVAMVTSFCCE